MLEPLTLVLPDGQAVQDVDPAVALNVLAEHAK